jgi:hypothetical protein
VKLDILEIVITIVNVSDCRSEVEVGVVVGLFCIENGNVAGLDDSRCGNECSEDVMLLYNMENSCEAKEETDEDCEGEPRTKKLS